MTKPIHPSEISITGLMDFLCQQPQLSLGVGLGHLEVHGEVCMGPYFDESFKSVFHLFPVQEHRPNLHVFINVAPQKSKRLPLRHFRRTTLRPHLAPNIELHVELRQPWARRQPGAGMVFYFLNYEAAPSKVEMLHVIIETMFIQLSCFPSNQGPHLVSPSAVASSISSSK